MGTGGPNSPARFIGVHLKNKIKKRLAQDGAKQLPEIKQVRCRAIIRSAEQTSNVDNYALDPAIQPLGPFAHTDGTVLANIDLDIGCRPSRSLFRHGGARNSASRTSDVLNSNQVRALIAASQRAVSIGRPLNRWITVHWEAAGVSDADAMKATTAFLKYWREWLRGETAYLWVRENGGGKGSHLHILAHLPQSRRWHGSRAINWIERCTNRPYRAGVLKSRPVAGAKDQFGELYTENLQRVLSYALKGAAPEVAAGLGIVHQPGGQIIGKRCGSSRNLAGPP